MYVHNVSPLTPPQGALSYCDLECLRCWVFVVDRKFRCEHCGHGAIHRRTIVKHTIHKHVDQTLAVIEDFDDVMEQQVVSCYQRIGTCALISFLLHCRRRRCVIYLSCRFAQKLLVIRSSRSICYMYMCIHIICYIIMHAHFG